MKQRGLLRDRNLRKFSPGIFVLALMIAGCATQNAREIDWRHGAQRAWFTREYLPTDLRRSGLDVCLANLPESERLAGRFGVVSVWHGRWRISKPARIPNGVVIEPGDEVELNPSACNSDQFPVINRILRRAVDPS